MKEKIHLVIRWLAKRISGYGLRERIWWLDWLYSRLKKNLAPHYVYLQGYQVYLDEGDSLGLSVDGNYEPGIAALMRKVVKPRQVALDIGSNIGYFSILLSDLVGSEGMVYCFEPDPITFATLDKNIKANRLSNVITEQVAVSDRSSAAFLRRDKFNNLDHRLVFEPDITANIAISTVSLDDYFLKNHVEVNFIKMDIQGAELLALEGMQGVLKKAKELRLLIEFWPLGLEQCSGKDSAANLLKKLHDLFDEILLVEPESGKLNTFIDDVLLGEMSLKSGKYANLFCYKQ